MSSKRQATEPLDSEEESEEEKNGEGVKKMRLRSSACHGEFTRGMKTLPGPGGKQEERSYCRHCSTSYVGKNPTTLMKHLRLKHPARAKEVEKSDSAQRVERQEAKSETSSKSSSDLQTASQALFGVASSSRNSRIDRFVTVSKKRSKSLPPRPREKEELSDRMLGFWVGGSTLPINFIEDPNFELYLKTYDIQVNSKSIVEMRNLS